LWLLMLWRLLRHGWSLRLSCLMFDFINDRKQALVELLHICCRRVHRLVKAVATRLLNLLRLLGWHSRSLALNARLRRRWGIPLVQQISEIIITVFACSATFDIRLERLLRLQGLLLLLDHLFKETGRVMTRPDPHMP